MYRSPADRLKELSHLFKRKYHKEHWALRDISLEVKKGETVGVIGRNGSGKSTLLQVICGTLVPTEGEVQVNGRVSALLELGAGFSPEFTGRENVYMNGAILGLTYEEIDARFDDIAAFADIGDFIDQPVRTYSSGMYVRLAFAVAINVDPDILIVDEALAVGDMHFQTKCLRKFENFQEKGITIILVSNDMNSIKKNCHEVMLFDEGKIIDKGDPKEIVDVYNALIFEKIAADIKGEKTFSSKEIASQRVNRMSQRYGTGEAKIIDVTLLNSEGVHVGALSSGEEGIFRIKVCSNTPVKDIVIGITIRNRMGLDIYGVNTLWKKKIIEQINPNDVLVVDFRQRMTLIGGTYTINVAINENRVEGLTRLDWISDVISFDIIQDEEFLGFCNLDSDISVQFI